jgi:hypothetical protein
MLRRIVWGLAGLVAAVVVSVPLWVQMHRADLPSPGDEELLAPEPAAGTIDGFPHVRAAMEQADGIDESESRLRAMLKREAWEPELLEDLLRRNSAALKHLERGLATDFVRIPDEYRAIELTRRMPDLMAVQQLVKLVAVDAQRLARHGDRSGAFERALLALRVGRRISEFENADLTAMMFAVACQSIGLGEVERLLHELPITASEARQLASRIEAQRIPADAWRAMWAVQYRSWKSLFAGLPIAEGDRQDLPIWFRWLPADYLYQSNRTLSQFAEYARERRAGSAIPCRETYASVASVPEDRRLEILLSPNPVGGLLAEMAIPNYEGFDLRRCHTETRLGLVQVAVALRAWTHDEGALPETLDVLVPTYLEALPLDRYDGSALRYSKAEAIVYSIGDDFADAGGFDPPSQSERSEPTISVAF